MSAQKNLYAKIMEIKDDMMLNELGEFEGTATAASKLYSDYDRLTEKYFNKYGDPGTFKSGGSVKAFSMGGVVKRSGTNFKGVF
tara:strand:+ start:2546 stop:2797 length:252 start_codon:yes stop_codon:yes gene_type:complete